MRKEEIELIVKLTVEDLVSRGLIVSNEITYQEKLKEVSQRLKDFFLNRGDGSGISYALHELKDDKYISIIFLQYQKHWTIEKVAGHMQKDVSTIKRNKKRLILEIYDILQRR